MFTIGQFSRITGLTVKTIRLYHEKGLIIPAHSDPFTGYRYFDQRNVEEARKVKLLRELEFPLIEIGRMLEGSGDDSDILGFLESRRDSIQERAKKLNLIVSTLDDIIRSEQEAAVIGEVDSQIVEKNLEATQIAGIRWKGRYSETGVYLGRVARAAGRHIVGKPMNLYWDSEYREEDADLESCFPVIGLSGEGEVTVRTLEGGPFVCLVHKGAYESIGRSYERVMAYAQDRDYQPVLPSREVYLKGPGMIFQGNPRNYLTEIQMPQLPD